ncbi:hypothetical protein Pla175_19820 [Pirellulimonas nuda]|uniref:Intein C-terminal splicing domain-containing protein n=2 Tax=Pirellulimonas nuda TaxID=2528009 RepID=A0A518DAV8_9BACT|nr:hypothetical protein Pla175_19820 [Pirellulimonas nuda]
MRHKDYAIIATLLIAAATCLWLGLSPDQPTIQPVVATTPVSLSSPRVVEQRIETIRVGQRVWVGENPSSELDLRFGDDVVCADWRQMTLRAPKRGGGHAEVEMLRPAWWLEEHGVRAGGEVDIEVPECGIEGRAKVLGVGPCPPIPPGPGRVVTATFHHQAAATIDVAVEGLAEPIGATPNHPFWSETEQRFVRADQLRPGEEVRTLHGTARVASISPRGPPEPVYNLEVHAEHVYRVGETGLLVHNGNPCNFVPSAELEASARTLHVTKVRNSSKEVVHASDQAKARHVFGSKGDATQAIKDLTQRIKSQGFPKGTTIDPKDPNSVLVPIGNGYAVFSIKKGRAQIETIID